MVIQSKEQIEKQISEQEFAYNWMQTLYNSADYKEYRNAFGEILETAPFRKYLYPDFTKNWFAIEMCIRDSGSRETGSQIKPFSTLIFEVELLGIEK